MAETTAQSEEKVVERQGVVRGFKLFLQNYGIAPLALGVVIGNAVNDLVKSLVDGLISPLLSLVLPDGRLQGLQVEVSGSVFKVGQVVNSLISFLIIVWIVYVIVKLILRNEKLLQKK